MNRYVVLYLATLVVLVALDFLFLGILAKGFFVAEVGDMLGEVRPVPAILFYLLYVMGSSDFCKCRRSRDAFNAGLRRVVRIVLLRDLRSHGACAAQALELGGCCRRRVLGARW